MKHLICIAVIIAAIYAGYSASVCHLEKDLALLEQARPQSRAGNGYFIQSSGEIDPSAIGSQWTVTKESDISLVQRAVPEVTIPSDIPPAFQFKALTCSTAMNGDWSYEFLYENEAGDTLKISREKHHKTP